MSGLFTPLGQRIEGAYENDRNADNAELFKAIVREAFDVKDCIVAHHIVYVTEELRPDGFKYQIVQEIPCADSLMFNHVVAKKLWGSCWRSVLQKLACEPVEDRDRLLHKMYYGRRRAVNGTTEGIDY